MAEVLLFHHIQGLTDGVRAFAEELREAAHTVRTPDLFEGRTFGSINEGFAFASDIGFDVLTQRGLDAAKELGPELVYAGFSSIAETSISSPTHRSRLMTRMPQAFSSRG